MGGGKSGGAGQTYNYYGTLAGGVCIGPGEELVAILINSEEVWPKGTPWALGINCNPGTLYVFDAQTWTCTVNHVATNDNAPGSGLFGWTEYSFVRGAENSDSFSLTASDDTYYGVMNLLWGTTAQTVATLLQAGFNDGGVHGNIGFGDQHPDYQGIVYVIIEDFLLGQEVQSGPNIEIVVRRKPQQTVIVDYAAGLADGQANLAAVAAEILTDKNCLGLPATLLDADSFQNVGDWLQTYQDKYGASVLIDGSETITSLFDKLTQMIDGFVRYNPTTDKIELGVYKHGVTPAPGTYVTLTADSLTKRPKFNSKSWQETISRATVRYDSRQLNYQQTSLQVDDPRAFFVLGAVREQSLDRPWITRPAQAFAHGQETLRVVGHAQMSGELEVRREIARNIRAGDYVLVDIEIEPGGAALYQFFRVTQRKISATGPMTLNVFADNTLAMIPAQRGLTPVVAAVPVVPPITNFRFVEVTTALSGERGEIVALAQRPSNLIVGAQLYFDTDPAGTFSSRLGTVRNFAAKATLASAVAIGDSTLHLTVDTTQVDAGFFTQQYSANQAADDTMLAFLVAVNQPLTDAGGDAIGGVGGDAISGVADGEAAQILEAGGFQVMEICSVSAQTLISAGRYDLTVLRGRKNTFTAAFDPASTEVWLIPANLLAFFNHQLFDQLRANRLVGAAPDHAQFRFCPYFFNAQLALSDAVSEPFQFPLKSASAPSFTLTSPNGYSQNYAAASYPFQVPVVGDWTDPDGNMVQVQVLLRKSTETTDRKVLNVKFSNAAAFHLNCSVPIDKAGTYTIKIIARDATNLVTERDMTVVVTGAGAVCAFPILTDDGGNQLFGVNGALPDLLSGHDINIWVNCDGTTGPYYNAGNTYELSVLSFVKPCILKLACSTPNVVIYFAPVVFQPSGPAEWNNTAGSVIFGGKLYINDSAAFGGTRTNLTGVLPLGYCQYIEDVNAPVVIAGNPPSSFPGVPSAAGIQCAFVAWAHDPTGVFADSPKLIFMVNGGS